MYCNHCGAVMTADQRFCAKCGKPVSAAPAPSHGAWAPAAGRVARHLSTLGIVWIAYSALRLLRGGGHLLGAPFMAHFGWFHQAGWGWPVGHFLSRILFVSGTLMVVLAVAGFVAGWGLIERQSWARPLALVLAFISLVSPLLGTILGIYTLWVLLPAQSEAEFRQTAR
jgi:hypothetical protein